MFFPSSTEDDLSQIGSRGYPLLGIYPQKQKNYFMQRIKVFGGRISWSQWRGIADLAQRYTNGTPIHITTRQDIELHNIKADTLKQIQAALFEHGLPIRGAGGDSIRNITVCTGYHYNPNTTEVYFLGQMVDRYLSSCSELLDLPRKFKISFSGCTISCAKPWLSDIGFILKKDGSFEVVGAGSLGPKPALGITLYKSLAARDVIPLCVAAIKMFKARGDRHIRHRARLRHVREKLGDTAFKDELDRRYKQIRQDGNWPEVSWPNSNRNLDLLWRLQLVGGNITPSDAIELADIAEPSGTDLRINLEHGLELYGAKSFQLPDKFASLKHNAFIVTCPGSTTCSRGLVNCQALAKHLSSNLASQLDHPTRICISGCPNGCAQSAVATIGLIGLSRKLDGHSVEHYRIFSEGGNGMDNRLSVENSVVSKDEVYVAVEELLKEQGSIRASELSAKRS